MAPLPDDNSRNDSGPVLEIKADNVGVTTVTSLLKTITFCEKVNVIVTVAGIRFVVEEGKYVQAIVIFKSELFKTFRLRDDECGFKIPFKELMDCLKILGGDPKTSNEQSDATNIGIIGGKSRTMHITYNGHGTPFCLSLEEQGMHTEIELKTEETDHTVDFEEVNKVWDIAIDPKLLHESLAEVESYSPDYVCLRVVPNKCLEFRAKGSAGSMKISIPKNCSGIERFCYVKEPHQATYKLSILKHSFKLIQSADKLFLQMGEMDVLAFRLLFKDSMESIASFYVMPVSNVDEDEDEPDVVL